MNDALGFDRYQFERPETKNKLYRRYDEEDVASMQVFRSASRLHRRPDWLESRDTLLKHLMSRIARLPVQYDKRDTLQRWLQVIHLYFVVGASARHVADQVGMTEGSVKQLLHRLRQ